MQWVQRYARDYGLLFEWLAELGKGSKGIPILCNCRAVAQTSKDELK